MSNAYREENALLREALNIAMAKLMLRGEDDTLRRVRKLVDRANEHAAVENETGARA